LVSEQKTIFDCELARIALQNASIDRFLEKRGNWSIHMTVTVYKSPSNGELVSSLANEEPAVVVLSCEITSGLEAGDTIIISGDMQATTPQPESSSINVLMNTQLILANTASAAVPASGSAIGLDYAQGSNVTPGAVTGKSADV
jgi:hypothetical protein